MYPAPSCRLELSNHPFPLEDASRIRSNSHSLLLRDWIVLDHFCCVVWLPSLHMPAEQYIRQRAGSSTSIEDDYRKGNAYGC
ncbi:hypothetical protein EJB05_44399, partial [Eragrostis curvula]